MLNMQSPKGITKQRINQLQKIVVMSRVEKEMRKHIKYIKRLRPKYEKALRAADNLADSINEYQHILNSLIKRRDQMREELLKDPLNKESVRNESH